MANVITNTGNNTITIDSTTSGLPDTMIVSNVLVSAPGGYTNLLSITAVGVTPFQVRNGFAIGSAARW